MIEDRIEQVDKAIIAFAEAEKRKEIACKAEFTDLSYIGKIYDICKRSADKGMRNVWDRRKFVFVILYLYCPTKIFGGRMVEGGLVAVITSALGLTSAKLVSKYSMDMKFYYTNYSEFHDDVNRMIEDVLLELK